MAGKQKSRRRGGKRSSCSYCHGNHRGGPKGNSCGGHSVKGLHTDPKVPKELDRDFDFDAPRTRRPAMTRDAIRRRQRAAERQKIYSLLTVEEKIAKAKASPGNSKRELERLQTVGK